MFPYTTRGKKYASKAEKSVRISQIWYDLSSVVVHKGKLDSGHYVCYCREAENVGHHLLKFRSSTRIADLWQWFLFDDSKVTLTPEAEVLGVDAYLLFYLVRSLDGCEPSATGPSA